MERTEGNGHASTDVRRGLPDAGLACCGRDAVGGIPCHLRKKYDAGGGDQDPSRDPGELLALRDRGQLGDQQTIYVANFSSNTVSVINGQTNTVVAEVPVGFFPIGVAVNEATNTIYVANATDNTVSVISGQTNTAVATIPVGSFAEWVAVNPLTNTVHVTNALDSTVSVINGQTNTVVATIPPATSRAAWR
ncbi:MAG TPA: YncE family protein [Actinomycetes bacterium]|nr:YncE family protein [Actinomycetes bacterium]